jgi:hypothetical protein
MRRAALSLAVSVAALVLVAPAYGQEPSPPEEPVVADGVTIAGVAVGGLTAEEATAVVQAGFDRRLVLRVGKRTLWVRPGLFSHPRLFKAVQAALAAPAGSALRLEVAVTDWQLKRWVKALARRFDRAPRNSRVFLRHLRPKLTDAVPGRKLRRYASMRSVRYLLRNHLRGPSRLPTRRIKPAITRWNFGKVIVIRRESKRLILYRSAGRAWMPVVRKFGVATGMAAYPTPLGRFSIAVKQRNPWWYPPSADWAEGAEPIPPGPGNPLGTRWMGLSIGGIGIHGTPDAASIGYSASHGCIRMRIPDAEWLFDRVVVGTPVFIVGA